MRRMRIVAWRETLDGERAYTLVMEWLASDGKTVLLDQRYRMDKAEFDSLRRSVLAAKPPAKRRKVD